MTTASTDQAPTSTCPSSWCQHHGVEALDNGFDVFVHDAVLLDFHDAGDKLDVRLSKFDTATYDNGEVVPEGILWTIDAEGSTAAQLREVLEAGARLLAILEQEPSA